MEASMDQTCEKGSRSRRILPYALAGVGMYAAIAYGSALFTSAPTQLTARPIAPADQMISAAAPLPAAPVQLPAQNPVTGTIGQVQSVGHDVLPVDPAAAARSLSSATTSTVIPGSASGAPVGSAGSGPASPLSGVPVVNNLPVLSSLSNVPLQNVTGSVTQPLSGLTGGSAGGAQASSSQPLKNMLPGVAGLSLPQVNGTTPLSGLLP
jgi:hypothetical protein